MLNLQSSNPLSIAALVITAVGCSPKTSSTNTESSASSAPSSVEADAEAPFAASKYTSAPKRVSVSADLDASPEQVWSYVSNHDNLVAYSGGVLSHASVDRSAATERNGVGTKRHCEMPDGSKFEENVVFFRAPSRFAYSLEPDNSWGLADHLGVVTIEPRDGGSTLTIDLYFNHPNVDEMVKNMTGMLKMKMMAHFTDKFGGATNG